MGVRQFIQPGIAGSVLAHLTLLGLVVLFSEVHPFGTVTAEPIVVDLVTPDEAANRPDQPEPNRPKPEQDQLQLQLPKEDVSVPAQREAAAAAPSPPPVPPAKQQQRTAPAERSDSTGQPAQQQQAAQLSPATPSSATPPPTVPLAPQPQQHAAYTPPEPDVTVKYGVMLGLPEALPPPAGSAGDKPGDGIDANASSAANISSSLVTKFREHLKSCSKLPASVARSDNIFVKLRVVMTPQARLAVEPILVEGTASAKALDLKEGAVKALAACQPYDMLPADRYGEWKVLDLSFTPQDFG